MGGGWALRAAARLPGFPVGWGLCFGGGVGWVGAVVPCFVWWGGSGLPRALWPLGLVPSGVLGLGPNAFVGSCSSFASFGPLASLAFFFLLLALWHAFSSPSSLGFVSSSFSPVVLVFFTFFGFHLFCFGPFPLFLSFFFPLLSFFSPPPLFPSGVFCALRLGARLSCVLCLCLCAWPRRALWLAGCELLVTPFSWKKNA